MPAAFTYPGVYITEKPSGAQAIPTAATSIALFVGMADRGPFEIPTRVQSLADYYRQFGETSLGEMADQVRQFFLNGGGDAYIMRIADGAVAAEIQLQSEMGANVMRVTARDRGSIGDLVRVEIDYATASPERTFNLTTYRSFQNADGTFGRTDSQTFTNLSMDPADPRFAPTIVNASSLLVALESIAAAPGTAGGVSFSGLLLNSTVATARTDLAALLSATRNSFRVSIDGQPPRTAVVDVVGITGANVENRIRDAIINAHVGQPVGGAGTVLAALVPVGAPDGHLLEIRSTEGPIVITPAATADAAVTLMLGTAAGGIEIDDFSQARPAPSGVFSRLRTQAGLAAAPDISWIAALTEFAVQDREQIADFTLADPGALPIATTPITIPGTGGDPIILGAVPTVPAAVGSLANVRAALDAIAASINSVTGTRWTAARQGLRLVLRAGQTLAPATGIDVELTTTNGALAGAGYDLGGTDNIFDRAQSDNIAAYTLGMLVGGGRQSNPVLGNNGTKPTLGEYNAAFAIIESEVEIFNMMVLPRAPDQTDPDRAAIWGAASSFCAAQRAILFVDPDQAWTDITLAEAGTDSIKIGVETRNAVVYWPRVRVPAATPAGVPVDPSGSMAGLYARIDARFGTWRAPAGIEATLTGVLGVATSMSDAQNGRINPKALNAIRLFPSGVTAWGARMMVGADDTGNIDDKYVNVRRMMLLIENSLYRGLRFAVFRNNAEPLWASIRLAAGAFMNSLMVQGAFASNTKSEAYYVVCDATTTTPNDINLGIVNVLVGFAPNKPAEFVHLVVTQIAGQVEV